MPTLMLIGAYAATGTLPPRGYVMPALPPRPPPELCYPSRKSQTPAPQPPTFIGVCQDHYLPLDHTPSNHPLPPESFVLTAVAAMPSKKGSSDSQILYLEEDDGDADNDYATKLLYLNERDNGCVDEGSSDNNDKKKTSGNNDDELFIPATKRSVKK
jgi:hypothetical protein